MTETAQQLQPISKALSGKPQTPGDVGELAHSLLEWMSDPMLICDSQGRICLANDAAGGLLGAPPASLRGRSIGEFSRAGRGQASPVKQLLESDQTRLSGIRYEVSGASGEPTPLLVNAHRLSSSDKPHRALLVLSSATQPAGAPINLDLPCIHGVRCFRSTATEQMREARYRGSRGCLVIIGLDRFSDINLSRGREAGGRLLQEVGPRIYTAIGGGGTVHHLGGDQFAAFFSVKSEDEALKTCENILHALSIPFVDNGDDVFLTASAGAYLTTSASTFDMAMESADTAMHAAKRDGRNQFCLYSESKARNDEADAGQALLRAMQSDELEVHVQPKYRTAGGEGMTLIGGEVLTRLCVKGTERSLALGYLQAAGRLGLLEQLDFKIIRKACDYIVKALERDPSLVFSINVSGRTFCGWNFPEEFLDAIKQGGVAPQSIILEITEDTFADDDGDGVRNAKALSDAGVECSIDDFGVGYSALSYLQRLPVKEIKIDRFFVASISSPEHGYGSQLILNAILSVARGIGLRIVAEGVERQEEVDWLIEAGVQDFQGYLLSKPLPFNEFLRSHCLEGPPQTTP